MAIRVRVRGRIRVRVRVRVEVKRGRTFPTHTCMHGRVSGMRIDEGGRHLVESEPVINREAHATYHKSKAAQLGIHHLHRIWVPVSHPMVCGPVTC